MKKKEKKIKESSGKRAQRSKSEGTLEQAKEQSAKEIVIMPGKRKEKIKNKKIRAMAIAEVSRGNGMNFQSC